MARLASFRPDVLLVERSVARAAQVGLGTVSALGVARCRAPLASLPSCTVNPSLNPSGLDFMYNMTFCIL